MNIMCMYHHGLISKTCEWQKLHNDTEYDRAGLWIIMFSYNIDEKQLIPGGSHCLCGDPTVSPCLLGFSPASPVCSHILKMCTQGDIISKLPHSECGCEYEYTMWWKGPLYKVGSYLVSWAAGIGSYHWWHHTGISKLENCYLSCFHSSLLNVGIAHIYVNILVTWIKWYWTILRTWNVMKFLRECK